MCGFVAIVRLDGAPAEPRTLERMCDVISHRGPDGSGVFVDGDIGLGFRRLSILDLSHAGDQPMKSLDERFVIVFNGEIYNFVELRAELEAHGHRFRSSGDTEVLLAAYIQWGPDCVNRFNGMWAFAIFDTRERSLFVSRDRFGIKPIYWYKRDDVLILASEIKSICESGFYESKVNWSVAGRFLATGDLEDSQETFYERIEKFPAGCFSIVQPGRELSFSRYWSIAEDRPDVSSDIAGQFADLFEDSVSLRMRSDVPVGVLLSGGLDSTSIICSVSRAKEGLPTQQREPTAAFSYNDTEFDESGFVADTIDQTGALLFKLKTDPTAMWNELDQLLSYHDEPAHSATAMIGYKLMELAADNGVKVVLNGQGADETLAGYPNYFENYWYTLLADLKIPEAMREMSTFGQFHGRSLKSLMIRQLGHIVRGFMSGIPAYRKLSRGRRIAAIRGSTWYSEDVLNAVQLPEQGRWKLRLDDALEQSVESFPMPLYLRVEDRNSMAHSVEARLPFLDYRLVRLAFAISANWKMRGVWNKYVLRQAMVGRIPESVRSRREKFGFPTPIDRWVREPMRNAFEELINDPGLRDSGLYNAEVIRADFDRHLRGETNIGVELFNLAQFVKWQRISGASAG